MYHCVSCQTPLPSNVPSLQQQQQQQQHVETVRAQRRQSAVQCCSCLSNITGPSVCPAVRLNSCMVCLRHSLFYSYSTRTMSQNHRYNVNIHKTAMRSSSPLLNLLVTIVERCVRLIIPAHTSINPPHLR